MAGGRKKQPQAKRRAQAKPKTKQKPKPKQQAKAKAQPKKKKATAKRARVTATAAQDDDDDEDPRGPVSVLDVLAAIEAASNAPLESRLKQLDATREQLYDLEASDKARALAALEAEQAAAIELALTDPRARAGLIESLRAAPWEDDRIPLLAEFGDEASYQLVRERALAELDAEYYETRAPWLHILGEFANDRRFADDVRGVLIDGFEQLAVKSRDATQRVLVNSVAFGALAHAAAKVTHPDIGPALLQAFRRATGKGDVRAHYELNLTIGPLALALASVGYFSAVPDIAMAVAHFDRLYPGDEFVMQCRYAQWFLTNDAEGAIAYLVDEDNKKNLSLAAAVLADLDHKPGRDAIAARGAALEHPVAREAFAEALHRLDTQAGRPAPHDRMIWMFGRQSSTEQALGHASDNEFVLRASEHTNNPEPGVVYEADNSAPTD